MKKPLTILLIIAEPLILLTILYAFWFHSPPLRDDVLWLLWFALPIFLLRMLVFKRIWTETLLHNLLILFVLLTIFNFMNAPLAREHYLVLLSRPLLGIWLYIYFVDHARTWGKLHVLALATVGMGLVVGIVSLTTTGWQMDKSGDMAFIINALPRFEWNTINWPTAILPPLKEAGLTFNPNEVAGALAYLVPVLAALAIGNPKSDTYPPEYPKVWIFMRVIAGIGFVISLLSLILGQSRFAIGGVLAALLIVVFLLIPGRVWKIVGLSLVALLILFQAALLFNLFAPIANTSDTIGISSRDQNTFSTRFELWGSAARMMLDYPLTGTGMSMFRTAVNQEAYQIDYYVRQGTTPPHAHNEWLQIGADLGIPGFLLFIAMQVVVLWMLYRGWCSNHPHGQIMAVAVFGGLLAHSVYGLGDAVTLWDRFSFILWWLVGLAGAQYDVVTQFQNIITPPTTTSDPVS